MRYAKILLAVMAACLGLRSSLWSVGFNIQGRLTDSNGVNRDGTFSMAISLYSASTGPGLLWKRTYPTVSVRNGSFQIFLEDPQDSGSPLETAMTHPDQAWAEIQVAGESAMVPRIKVGATPFALAVQGASSSGNRLPASGNVGIGTTAPAEKITVEGGHLKFNSAGMGIKWADGSSLTSAPRLPNIAVLELVSGDQTTTSSAYVPVFNSQILLNNVSAGGRVQYSCTIVAGDALSADKFLDFQAQIDGAPLIPGETTLSIFMKNNGEIYHNSFIVTTPPLPAGAHTFSLKFKNRGGNLPRVLANPTYPLRCTALELH